jgi:hypothetical protein
LTYPKKFTIHDYAPLTKPKGNVRLIYKNVNGLNNKLANNEKMEKAKRGYMTI